MLFHANNGNLATEYTICNPIEVADGCDQTVATVPSIFIAAITELIFDGLLFEINENASEPHCIVNHPYGLYSDMLLCDASAVINQLYWDVLVKTS